MMLSQSSPLRGSISRQRNIANSNESTNQRGLESHLSWNETSTVSSASTLETSSASALSSNLDPGAPSLFDLNNKSNTVGSSVAWANGGGLRGDDLNLTFFNITGNFTGDSAAEDTSSPLTWFFGLLVLSLMCYMSFPNIPSEEYRRGRRAYFRQQGRERRRRDRRMARLSNPKWQQRAIAQSLIVKHIVSKDADGNLTLGSTSGAADRNENKDSTAEQSPHDNHSIGHQSIEEGDEASTCVICLEPFRVGDVVAWKRPQVSAENEKQPTECTNIGSSDSEDTALASLQSNPNVDAGGEAESQRQCPQQQDTLETASLRDRQQQREDKQDEECLHVFHKECIVSWLENTHDDCPSCRKIILEHKNCTPKKTSSDSDGESNSDGAVNDNGGSGNDDDESSILPDDLEQLSCGGTHFDDNNSVGSGLFFIMNGLVSKARRASYSLIGESIEVTGIHSTAPSTTHHRRPGSSSSFGAMLGFDPSDHESNGYALYGQNNSEHALRQPSAFRRVLSAGHRMIGGRSSSVRRHSAQFQQLSVRDCSSGEDELPPAPSLRRVSSAGPGSSPRNTRSYSHLTNSSPGYCKKTRSGSSGVENSIGLPDLQTLSNTIPLKKSSSTSSSNGDRTTITRRSLSFTRRESEKGLGHHTADEDTKMTKPRRDTKRAALPPLGPRRHSLVPPRKQKQYSQSSIDWSDTSEDELCSLTDDAAAQGKPPTSRHNSPSTSMIASPLTMCIPTGKPPLLLQRRRSRSDWSDRSEEDDILITNSNQPNQP